jgi:predicted ATPase
MRSLDRVQLDLASEGDAGEPAVPTVLIGPNGSGKSTILEACELLRRAATERSFMEPLFHVHGGPSALFRRSSARLVIGVQCRSDAGVELAYELTLLGSTQLLSVEREIARVAESSDSDKDTANPGGRVFLDRTNQAYRLTTEDGATIEGDVGARGEVAYDQLALASLGRGQPMLTSLREALASIEVHTAIEARAPWAAGSTDAGPRASNVIRPATRVEQGGRNLPNVYHALRQQKDWPQTLARIRLALGEQIEDVMTPADPSGGRIGLALRIAGIGEVPAFSMSDGQLSYLALLGVLRLHRPSPAALVAFDEPDLHLHPSLARRLTSDLETFARSAPVLVATQSDAMLDALSEPARSSVLCDLDEHYATQLVRPDPESLRRWLEDYRGLGELRAAGYEGVVFPTLETP